jgi:hypothetical protein
MSLGISSTQPKNCYARAVLLADLGALHARYPSYNAQTVLEIVRQVGANRVLLPSLIPETWQSGAWRDLDHPVLFALSDERIVVKAIGNDWTWAELEQDKMLEFLKLYPHGQERLRELRRAELDLKDLLEKPLDAFSTHGLMPEIPVLEVVKAFHNQNRVLLEEGPGTAHRRRRLQELFEKLKLENLQNTVVLTPLDDLPDLLEMGLKTVQLEGFKPGEASRFRAVVDRAYNLHESDDLDRLVHSLLELDGAPDSALGRIALEARFAASGVYLAVGDLESARDLLEAVAMGQFEHPAYLPGFVLARLGQVRDLMNERQPAIRAYTAALALQWLPLEAKNVAQSGLLAPFTLSEHV